MSAKKPVPAAAPSDDVVATAKAKPLRESKHFAVSLNRTIRDFVSFGPLS